MDMKKKPVNKIDEEEKILLKSASIASSKAIRSSFALGLTIEVIKGNKVIEISPDKTEKVIRTIPKPANRLPGLKKGMILKRK
jgi:uncharacterized protein (DUF1778 family)